MAKTLSVQLINKAKNISKCSNFDKYHIGVIIFKKNKILASGFNSYKESPVQRRYNTRYRHFSDGFKGGCVHAEIDAIKDLIKNNSNINYSKLSIMIYRERKDGKYALAKPCPACEHALRDLGIKDVYYTGNDSIVHEIYN